MTIPKMRGVMYPAKHEALEGLGFPLRASKMERSEVRRLAMCAHATWELREKDALVEAMRIAMGGERPSQPPGGSAEADARFQFLRAIAARLHADEFQKLLDEMHHMTTDKEVADAYQIIPKEWMRVGSLARPEFTRLFDQKLALVTRVLTGSASLCPSCMKKVEETSSAPAFMDTGKGSCPSVNAAVEDAIEEQRPAYATMGMMKRELVRRWEAEDETAWTTFAKRLTEAFVSQYSTPKADRDANFAEEQRKAGAPEESAACAKGYSSPYGLLSSKSGQPMHQHISIGRAIRCPESASSEPPFGRREAFTGTQNHWSAYLVARDAGIILVGEQLYACLGCSQVTNRPEAHRRAPLRPAPAPASPASGAG